VWGSNNIIRYNYWGECNTNDFPGTDHHIDGIQWFPDSDSPLWRTMVYGNRMYSNYTANSHAFIIQRTSADISEHFTYRRNVVSYNGSETLALNPFTGAYMFNNTIVDATLVTAANYAMSMGERDGFSPTNNHYLNNIVARGCRDTASGGLVYLIEGGVSNWGNYTLRYQTGTPTVNEPNDIEDNPDFTVDPLGTATPGTLTIQSSSPAVNAGRALLFANGAGSSSTSLIVHSNVFYLYDGFGMANADWIVIGSGLPVQISSINDATSTITLSEARSWSSGDGVWEATSAGKMDDIGAYEFRNSYTLTATYSVNGTDYTAVPSDISLCEMVIFYQDGIAHTRDYTTPYTATITSGAVTIRAYPKFAPLTTSTNMSVLAALDESGGSSVLYRNRGRALRAGGFVP
jgi:hypothetical protein